LNYFFEGVFKDGRFWRNIVFSITIIVAFLDYSYNFFGGILALIVTVLVVISLISVGIKTFVVDINNKNKKVAQNTFEVKKRLEIRNIIRNNPTFQTMCFNCKHFNRDGNNCNITFDIENKKAFRTRFKDSRFEYCLYWERETILSEIQN
jgi:hypothetical protein